MFKFTERQWKTILTYKTDFISKGSQGDVSKMTIMGIDVAVKRFKHEEDFVKEVEYLNNCACHYVLRIFGITSTPEAIFFDYYPFDLESYFENIHQQEQDGEHRIYSIIHDIIYAVTYIHRIGYIHLDIRPKNFLLNQEKCVICDFGLAIEDAEPYNHNRGIDMWVAPEIAMGQTISQKTDIYSLSLVLYYVLTRGRQSPFEHSTTPDMIRTGLMSKQHPKISKKFVGKEEKLLELIKQMWVFEQELRPSAEDIKAFIDHL